MILGNRHANYTSPSNAAERKAVFKENLENGWVPEPELRSSYVPGSIPDGGDWLTMVAIGTAAGALENSMGAWSAPLAMAGGGAAFGGVKCVRSAMNADRSTIGWFAGTMMGGLGVIGAQVGSQLGLNPIVSAAVTSVVLATAIKLNA